MSTRTSSPEASVDQPTIPDPTEDKFSWVTVDSLTVPCLVRDGLKFVAVRMMESKLLARYPSQSAQELHTMPPLASFYMSKEEAEVLTTVNTDHCAKQFGEEAFTEHDLIVKLNDFREFYAAVKKLFSGKLLENGGWCQINNTLVPYIIRRKGEKFVPLNVVRYAAGLLNNTKVAYVYPTQEECFLLNEKCQSATMNFVFTISTKLVSLEKVGEVYSSVKIVESPKSACPTSPTFSISDSTSTERVFGLKNHTFPFHGMMPLPTHEFTGMFKEFNSPWGGAPIAPLYNDSLSTPRAALMLERMAAWSKLQEEINFTNYQNYTQYNNDTNSTSIPGSQPRTSPGSISNFDQQSILQKIGVNVNIHLNGKFDGEDTSGNIKNKRKGHTPLRYSPIKDGIENERIYESSSHPSITGSPDITSTAGHLLGSDIPLAIGRQPPSMFNFQPGAPHRPALFGPGISHNSTGIGSVSTSSLARPGLPTSPLNQSVLPPFVHPPPHLMHQHLPMWKYDYFKNTMANSVDKILNEQGLRLTQSAEADAVQKDDRINSECCTSVQSECRSSPKSHLDVEESGDKPHIEIIVDGIRCTPVIGNVLLQTQHIATLFHETLECDLVLIEEVGKEFFDSSSPEVVCDLMHIAVSILHIPTFNIMSNYLSNNTPSWQPKVALRLEDLVKHIDILKFLVSQKKDKQKMHLQSITNNNIPGGFLGGGVGVKRPREVTIDDMKCKIPRISPSPTGYGGPLQGIPLGHSLGHPLSGRFSLHGQPTSPSEFMHRSQGLDKSPKMFYDSKL